MSSRTLGLTDFRPGGRWADKPIALAPGDRLHHLYLIGRTGTGKSTLLGNLVRQDIATGDGCALLDPHGDLVISLVEQATRDRPDDLLNLDLADPASSFYLNPVADVQPAKRPLAVAGIVEVFAKLWADDWGPRLEHLLRNVIWTLLERPNSSLLDVARLLSDRDFREDALRHVENPEVVAFWRYEFARYSPGFRAVVVAPLQNKIGAFLSDPRLRRILGGKRLSVNFRKAMDQGRVLLVSLPKGRIGEGPAALLGSLLVSSLSLAALSRADVPEEGRRPFFIYLDEFHTFTTLSLATMLAELRKYRIGLVLAHQYLGQLEPAVRDAVLGNVGTLIAFRVGAQDAPLIARELAPVFEPVDPVNLPNYHIYLRLLIDGEPSRPFSARTLSPTELDTILR